MYDTVAEAIPLAQQGQNRKKALVVISDGNDTTSRTDIRDLKQQIRQSEVLVYAVGIDGEGAQNGRRPTPQPPPPPRTPMPIPFPFPGGAAGRGGFPQLFPPRRAARVAGTAEAGSADDPTIASTSPRCAT